MNPKFNQLKTKYPSIYNLMNYEPFLWLNQDYLDKKKFASHHNFSMSDLIDAENRYQRFAPFFENQFPDTKENNGLIESSLMPLKDYKEGYHVYLKRDDQLPISGSIKARGGIYEVILYAESLLLKNGLITLDDDYSCLSQKKYKDFLSKYKIIVSSTGNLGLSIGIISATLGFKVEVHMSRDAMTWKKQLLKSIGAKVIEYPEDYSMAVVYGRASAEKDSRAYFVDDESSVNLFLGYGVAALRLENQLKEQVIHFNKHQPLFIYIPCGVGGGPGGIAWAIKEVFGENAHVIFVEPTHAPCMLLGMMTGLHDAICVGDIGLDNITIADGLAVGRPSAFVGKIMMDRLLGISTVEDQELLKTLKHLKHTYNIFLEPSAVAGFKGFEDISMLKNNGYITPEIIKSGHHIIWATGGNMVPEDVRVNYMTSL